jgi:hypothetical protein
MLSLMERLSAMHDINPFLPLCQRSVLQAIIRIFKRLREAAAELSHPTIVCAVDKVNGRIISRKKRSARHRLSGMDPVVDRIE